MRIKLTLALLFTMGSALAVTYQTTINDSDFDAGTYDGAIYYIKTQLNLQVAAWRPGDFAVLNQNGVKYLRDPHKPIKHINHLAHSLISNPTA